MPSPISRLSVISSSMIAACTETSSAEVISSHTSNSGSAASARDSDALALAAAELIGIADLHGWSERDALQAGANAVADFGRRKVEEDVQRAGDALADHTRANFSLTRPSSRSLPKLLHKKGRKFHHGDSEAVRSMKIALGAAAPHEVSGLSLIADPQHCAPGMPRSVIRTIYGSTVFGNSADRWSMKARTEGRRPCR